MSSDGSSPEESITRFARQLLIVQYQARLSPRSNKFVWPDSQALLLIQNDLYQDLFANSVHKASHRYEITFLKKLIERLQDAVDVETERLTKQENLPETEAPEVDDHLLTRFVELMSTGSSQLVSTHAAPAETEYVSYLWQQPLSVSSSSSLQDRHNILDGFSQVTLREEGSAISRGTTGLKTWEASLRLAAHLLSQLHIVSHPKARILELGSGAGLLGTFCALLQKSAWIDHPSTATCPRTWLTDVPGQVVDRLRETLKLNSLLADSHVQTQEVDWIEVQQQQQQRRIENDEITKYPLLEFLHTAKPTLILAADVVYDPLLIEPLVDTIRIALEAGQTQSVELSQALVASTIRNPETYLIFTKTLVEKGLKVTTIPLGQTYLGSRTDPLDDPLPLGFFPSSHDPVTNGIVQLVCITL